MVLKQFAKYLQLIMVIFGITLLEYYLFVGKFFTTSLLTRLAPQTYFN